METNLLDRMLNTYLADQTPVTLTLQNKIRVSGKIRAFDSYVIIMEGQKREIVYRHAISSISTLSVQETKRTAPVPKPVPARAAARSPKSPGQKQRAADVRSPALSASATETGINNSMKEGLLKWMQEQNTSK